MNANVSLVPMMLLDGKATILPINIT